MVRIHSREVTWTFYARGAPSDTNKDSSFWRAEILLEIFCLKKKRFRPEIIRWIFQVQICRVHKTYVFIETVHCDKGVRLLSLYPPNPQGQPPFTKRNVKWSAIYEQQQQRVMFLVESIVKWRKVALAICCGKICKMNVFSLAPLHRVLNIIKALLGFFLRIIFWRKKKEEKDDKRAEDDGRPIEIVSVGQSGDRVSSWVGDKMNDVNVRKSIFNWWSIAKLEIIYLIAC